MTMGVRQARRRQGIGELLLIGAIELAAGLEAGSMTLEVRPSNTAAVAIYRKYGFHITGRRYGYYSSEQEDAIIMSTGPIGSTTFQERFNLLKQEYIRDHSAVLREME